MIKEKIFIVEDWKEFRKLMDNLNHYKYTFIIDGFYKKPIYEKEGVKFKTEKIILRRVDVNILKHSKEKKEKIGFNTE